MMLLPDNLYHNDDTRDNVSRLFFGEMTKNITPFFQLSVEDMLCVSSRSPFFNFFQIVLNNKFLQQTKWFSEPLQYNYWLNRAVKTKTFVNTSEIAVHVRANRESAGLVRSRRWDVFAVGSARYQAAVTLPLSARGGLLCWKKIESCAALMTETCAWLLYFRGNDMHRPIRPQLGIEDWDEGTYYVLVIAFYDELYQKHRIWFNCCRMC